MKQKTTRWIISLLGLLLLVIVAEQTFFKQDEAEICLVQRFGEIKHIYIRELTDDVQAEFEQDGVTGMVKTGTGLHVKIPFIDHVEKYSAKLNTYEVHSHEVITKDKKRLTFSNNAQWKIENPYRFYKAAKTKDAAEHRIDDRLYSSMNAIVGKATATELITDKDASRKLMEDLTNAINESCLDLGIRTLDIRIKRTDLPAETYESIYNNMNTERKKVAAQYRSEGEEEYIKVKSKTDSEIVRIRSEATRESERVKGDADAQAAKIYNTAYGKTPEFYEFYTLLETYKQTLGGKTTLVVPLDSPLAKALLGG